MTKQVIFLTSINFMTQHVGELYIDAIEKKYKVELWDLGIAYKQWEKSPLNESRAVIIQSFSEFDIRIKEKQGQGYQLLFVADIVGNILLQPIIPICWKRNIPLVCISKESLSRWLFG